MTRNHTNARGPNAKHDVVAVSHPDKIWWPDDGITKGDIIRFYETIAERIDPWLANRPLVAERCPDGMRGSCFFQKDFANRLPDTVPRVPIVAKTTGRMVEYVVGGSPAALLALVNAGCIAIHTMNCRTDALEKPDWMAFDLDPTSGDFADAVRVGRVLHDVLEERGLHSFPKTSGARGLHVLVPLRRGPDQDAVRACARALASAVVARIPDAATLATTKSERRGRVYVDIVRNAFGQTIAAPYSVRRQAHAPVSTPLAWDEVRATLDPGRFDIRTLARRLATGDSWSGFWQRRQSLPHVREGAV